MAMCIIVSGTRVCDGSPVYRVNGSKVKHPFPTLSKAKKQRFEPVATALRKYGRDAGVDPSQTRLATTLLQTVLAENWNATKAANAKNIEQSVRLMLVDEIGELDDNFTLVAY
jgi:hypothetical protein